MDAELPKRLYEQGTEPQVDKINNSCKTSILDFLSAKMPDEYNAVKRDPVFAPIFAIHENHLGFSATLVHSMMCRQLLTAKKHELWFVFARRPLRFSMQEYHAVTGLKCEDDGNYDLQNFVDDGGFWSKLLKRGGKISILSIKKSHMKDIHRWTHVDRLRLVYLCVIAGVLMAKDEKMCISDEYIKLVMDFDKLRAYPWGLRSFDYLVQSIINTRVKLSSRRSYVLRGFNYAFQVWIMEAIPDIGTMLGTKFNEVAVVSPRCSNWRVTKSLAYHQIISLENLFGSKDILHSYISSNGNMDVICDQNFLRDDEMRDERVDHLNNLISDGKDWSDYIWGFDEHARPEPSSPEQQEEDVERESGDEVNDYMTPCADDQAASSSRKGKRKVADKGAETRKQQLLTQRAARKGGDNMEDMKCFLRAMFQELQAQNARDNEARYGKLESEVSSLKTEVSQLKDLLSEAITQRNIGEQPTSSTPASVIPPPIVTSTRSQRKVKKKNNS